MTDQEINIAIAQACGWKWFGCLNGNPKQPAAFPPSDKNMSRPIPDYCHDLNAMHEAVFVLSVGSASQPGQYETYCQWLDRITGDDGYSATARQRAEAFLRCMGLWRDT
jgi:hypothetical protein